METWFRRSWRVVAIVSLLTLIGLIGALVSCGLTTACAPRGESDGRPRTVDGKVKPVGLQARRGVEHATEADFRRRILESDVPVLVDFYADWCGPCKMFAPVLEEVAQETPGVKVVKVNVDRNRKLTAQYGIRSIPSVIVFKDGEVTARHVGFAEKEELQELLDSQRPGDKPKVSQKPYQRGS